MTDSPTPTMKAKASSAAKAEPFRHTLTSAERGVHLDTWQIASQNLDPRPPVTWTVRKHTLHGGKQEGVDVIEVDNGRLRFTVIPTRGMSVLRVDLGDVRLGWDSPVKDVVHPQYINLQSRGGLGWLEGFNEWLVRCGLESAGAPGRDQFITNTGAEAEMELTLHGKIGNLPASEVEVVIDREPPHRLRLRGRVDERMLFGPKLELWTEISTEPGSDAFRVDDTVRNCGAQDQEFQLLYHINFGPPLLEKGARFAAPVKQVTPINAHAATAVASFSEYAGPTKGCLEQVYCLQTYADGRDRTVVMLQNAAADRAASIVFSTAQLPCLTLWKNTSALADGYVTGIEPATGFPHNRGIERKFGRVPKLSPNQRRRFTTDFQIHVGPEAVKQAADRVARLQTGRPTQVDTEPMPVE
jgi:hypothetical protein